MQMNTSEHSEALPKTDHVKGRRSGPGVGGVPQVICSNEPTPPRDLVGSHVPDEDDFEPFVGGAGI
jgi:hypothetical protein